MLGIFKGDVAGGFCLMVAGMQEALRNIPGLAVDKTPEVRLEIYQDATKSWTLADSAHLRVRTDLEDRP